MHVNRVCGIVMTQILFSIFIGGYTYILAILPVKIVIKILLFMNNKRCIINNTKMINPSLYK